VERKKYGDEKREKKEVRKTKGEKNKEKVKTKFKSNCTNQKSLQMKKLRRNSQPRRKKGSARTAGMYFACRRRMKRVHRACTLPSSRERM
jgi:hypothetical protein